MPAFGNPVAGFIRPMGSPAIVGSFRVVCDFACHEARTPPTQGIDIGDGTSGKPVLAMTTGIISLIRPGKVGSTASADASIFRIRRADGWEVGVAHLRIKAGLAVGQSISEGTQVGTVDKIGATAAHVHWGTKDPQGTEVDGWPLLRQNGATEDEEVITAPILERISNRRGLIPRNAKFRADPSTANPELRILPAGSSIDPDFAVTGGAVVGSTRWLTGMAEVNGKQTRGYLHESVVGPLVPIEDADCTDEVEAATAPLKVAIAQQQSRINEAKVALG